MISDDYGETWFNSDWIRGGNECQIAICEDDILILNMRTNTKKRQISYSKD